MYGGEEFDFVFGFKIYLIRYPKQFITFSLLATLVFFGFIIRVVERPIMELLENPTLKDWTDILWFCIITTSTSSVSLHQLVTETGFPSLNQDEFAHYL